MALRTATESDLDAIVAISSTARDRLEDLEPTFWRRHADADINQRLWFGVLLSDEAHHACVSTNSAGQVDGFVFARAMDAPPVYDPGGRTCLVDDFVWPNREVAQSLIDHVRTWATARGCSQLVIITPAADRDRKTLLDSIGLHPTSEWWTGPA